MITMVARAKSKQGQRPSDEQAGSIKDAMGRNVKRAPSQVKTKTRLSNGTDCSGTRKKSIFDSSNALAKTYFKKRCCRQPKEKE